jgi:hypothetical protein
MNLVRAHWSDRSILPHCKRAARRGWSSQRTGDRSNRVGSTDPPNAEHASTVRSQLAGRGRKEVGFIAANLSSCSDLHGSGVGLAPLLHQKS